MAEKLEIGVVAETDSAKKGLDDLAKSLDDVGKAADDAASSASKSTTQWETQAQTMARVGIEAKTASTGVSEVATATLTASKATAIAQTRFQKFASALSNFGRTAVRAITSGFSGLVSGMANLGRMAGRALATGFVLGAGAIAAFLIVAAKILNKLMGLAEAAGKDAAKALSDAFGAGLTLGDLTQIQGAFAGIFPDPDDARKAAVAIGELNAAIRTGSSEGKQAQEAARLLGLNLANLAKGGSAAFGELVKLQDVFKQMDQVQQRDLLKLLFPGAPDEVLAQIDQALEGTKQNLLDMGKAADTAGAQIAASIEKDKAFGKAAADMASSWDKLLAKLKETTGIDFSWSNQGTLAFQDLQAVIDLTTTAVTGITDLFRKAGTAASDFAKGIGDLAKAGWDAIVSGINSIIGVIDSLIAKLSSAMDWIKKLGSQDNAFNLPGPPMLGPQMAPQRFQGIIGPAAATNAMLRGAQAGMTQQSNLMGRASPKAANDNATKFGPAMSKQLDEILWNWKEIEKQSKKTGDAVSGSAAKQTEALKTVNEQMDVNLAASQLSAQQLTDWAASVLQASDSTFEYRAALAKLDEAYKRGIISTSQYQTALAQLQADLGGGGLGNTIKDLTDSLVQFGEEAANSFVDAALNGEDFSKVLQDMLKDLVKLLIQMLVIKPLFDSLSGALGGITGLSAAPAGVPLAAMQGAQGGLLRAGQTLSPLNSNLMGVKKQAGGSGGVGPTTVNSSMNGDINIDMSQTGAVAADSNSAKQFGQNVQKLIQVEMVRELRPGGLLRVANGGR